MQQSLMIYQLPGGRYGRLLTRVGWFKHLDGDNWVVVDSRIVVRKRQDRFRWDGLDRLADNGPEKEGYKLYDPMIEPQPLHVLWLIGPRVCRLKGTDWLEACPKPNGWGARP